MERHYNYSRRGTYNHSHNSNIHQREYKKEYQTSFDRRRSERQNHQQHEKTQPPNPIEREKLLKQIESERKTVFVRGISHDTTDEEIKQFFSKCGEVEHAQQVIDPTTNKSRGFGYVEFKSIEGVERALGMSGSFLKGNNPIYVSETNADQNRNKQTITTVKNTLNENKSIRIQNIVTQLSENDIRKVFGMFSGAEIVNLNIEKENESYNIITIEYKNQIQAMKAVELYNGKQFKNDRWIVTLIEENKGGEITLEEELLLEQKKKEMIQTRLEGTNALCNQENRNNYKSICVHNMFNKKEESVGFEKVLENDIRDELEQYCKVNKIVIDTYHEKGLVYVVFDTSLDAQKAFGMINLRWFNKRIIKAEYFPEDRVPILD